MNKLFLHNVSLIVSIVLFIRTLKKKRKANGIIGIALRSAKSLRRSCGVGSSDPSETLILALHVQESLSFRRHLVNEIQILTQKSPAILVLMKAKEMCDEFDGHDNAC